MYSIRLTTLLFQGITYWFLNAGGYTLKIIADYIQNRMFCENYYICTKIENKYMYSYLISHHLNLMFPAAIKYMVNTNDDNIHKMLSITKTQRSLTIFFCSFKLLDEYFVIKNTCNQNKCLKFIRNITRFKFPEVDFCHNGDWEKAYT